MPLLLSVIFEPLMVALRWLGVAAGGAIVASVVQSFAMRVGVFVGALLFVQGLLTVVESVIGSSFSAVGSAYAPVLTGLSYTGVIHALNILMSFKYYQLVIKTQLYKGATAPVGRAVSGYFGTTFGNLGK